MRSVAVVGRKGGSGKTTIAVHLALGFHLRGRRTMLADSDPQLSSSHVLSARTEPGPQAVATSGSKLFALKLAAIRDETAAMVIDTPAVIEDEVAQAVVLAELAVLVVRPTFLDLTAAVRTSDIIRRLRRPGIVVLNQAPTPRESIEPPMVKKAQEVLKLLRLPVAPVIVRSRAPYQTVMETGRSAEEAFPDTPAGREMAELCDFIDRFTFGRPALPIGGL